MTVQHRAPASPEDLTRIAKVRAMCASGDARRIREKARVTLREVATAIGADMSAVARWETGAAMPTTQFVLAYGDALKAMARSATRTKPRRRAK